MVKLQKKQVKIISVLIALVFIGSVVALALTQSGSGIASAASSNVGVVDYRQIAQQKQVDRKQYCDQYIFDFIPLQALSSPFCGHSAAFFR